MKIENQLDKKWDRYYIGKVKTSSFHNFACFLFCLTYLFSIKMKKQISPAVVDDIFIKNGVYIGDEIDSVKAAKVLGLQYFGKEFNIDNAPNWWPSIKQVDYSIKDGKQSHFVVREMVSGVKVILDPLGGVVRNINYYENKVKNLDWNKNNYFSYRLFKVNQ